MNYDSQNQDRFDLPALPPRRWSLLSVRAWTHGMGIGQVPLYIKPGGDSMKPIPALPEIEPSIRGAQRYQLEQSKAAIQREWDLQAQAFKEAWVTGYRREYYQAWLPFHMAPPGVSRDPKPAKSSTVPDPIVILCPSHLVSQMLDSAASMLVLCPGRVTLRDSKETVEVQQGPCLTLVQGYMCIVAHVLLDKPPAIPTRLCPASYPEQVKTEFQEACAFTHDYLGGGLYYWIPMLSNPQETSIQRY